MRISIYSINKYVYREVKLLLRIYILSLKLRPPAWTDDDALFASSPLRGIVIGTGIPTSTPLLPTALIVVIKPQTSSVPFSSIWTLSCAPPHVAIIPVGRSTLLKFNQAFRGHKVKQSVRSGSVKIARNVPHLVHMAPYHPCNAGAASRR